MTTVMLSVLPAADARGQERTRQVEKQQRHRTRTLASLERSMACLDMKVHDHSAFSATREGL